MLGAGHRNFGWLFAEVSEQDWGCAVSQSGWIS